jgi:hypothetical protein
VQKSNYRYRLGNRELKIVRADYPLDKQLTQTKSQMRQIRQTVGDVEDARTIERAKSAHGNKPRIPWSQVKKEAGLD